MKYDTFIFDLDGTLLNTIDDLTDSLNYALKKNNLNEYKVTVMACVPGIYERIFMMIRKNLEKQGKLEEILRKEEEYKNSSMEER